MTNPDVPDELVDAVARILDEQDMAGGGSRWNDVEPPGWQSQDALRAAYRHMAAEVLAVIRRHIADELTAMAQREARAQDYFSELVREATMDALLVAARLARGGAE